MRFTSSASKLLHLVNYLISWPTPRKWCLSQVGSCVFRITPQEADVSPPVRSDRSVFTEPSHVSQPPLKSVFTPKPRSKVASPSILHAGLPTTFDKWSFFSPPHAHLSAHAEISLAQSQWSLVEIYLYMYDIYIAAKHYLRSTIPWNVVSWHQDVTGWQKSTVCLGEAPQLTSICPWHQNATKWCHGNIVLKRPENAPIWSWKCAVEISLKGQFKPAVHRARFSGSAYATLANEGSPQ